MYLHTHNMNHVPRLTLKLKRNAITWNCLSVCVCACKSVCSVRYRQFNLFKKILYSRLDWKKKEDNWPLCNLAAVAKREKLRLDIIRYQEWSFEWQDVVIVIIIGGGGGGGGRTQLGTNETKTQREKEKRPDEDLCVCAARVLQVKKRKSKRGLSFLLLLQSLLSFLLATFNWNWRSLPTFDGPPEWHFKSSSRLG